MANNSVKSTRLGLPNLGLGVGLRSTHFSYLMHHPDVLVDWFEIISENFMDNFGYARYVLEQIAQKCPIVMHGVSMRIGSTDPINFDYLKSLKELIDFVQPVWISDHLCWTGHAHRNTHDLLPMPLTEESLQHVTDRVLQVQDYLKRPLILENPSTYLEFNASTMSEWDYLGELVKRTDCGLLLDVNNVYVSAYNHGYDAAHYIQSLPHQSIVQIHIAGPTYCGNYMIDTHDHPVPATVWQLYRLAQELTGGVSTLLEWDADIPEYPALVEELYKAKQVMQGNIPDTEISQANPKDTLAHPINFQLADHSQLI